MNTRLKYLVALWLCLFQLPGISQKENDIWYFGNQAGLNFSITPPAVLTNGVLNTSEGCASVSDANGNLLFYTDGSNIYNAQHTTMSNGTGLNGNSSTTQAAVIVKKPMSSTIYYVFSLGVGGTGALNYSTVDMTLANGSGSVVVKNATVAPSPLSEKMTSVRHCNGVDVWVITHGMSSSNQFLAFLVTSTGVNTTPVVSSIGSNYSGTAFCGNMKASPNGSKIGVAIQGPVHAFEIFDFNSATGVLSNSLSLGSFQNAYGCEFSPDGTKFYGTREYGTGSQALFQWDLCAGSNNAIIASQFSLATTSNIYGMQLATDGKIYAARFGGTLAVIHNPNALGGACSYTHNGHVISPKSCSFNLPNFVTSGFKAPVPPFTFTVNNSFGCQAAAFTAPAVATSTTQNACSASGYSVTGMLWNFGNPASGSANTSTLTNPIHAFTTLGTYTVSLVLNYACGGGMDTIRQVVNINQPCISVSSTSITCASLGSATVAATGGIGPFSYTWMPGNQTGSVATGLSPGTYTLTVFDFGNNFTYTANAIFTSLIPLTGSTAFQPSVACHGASVASASVINIAGGSGAQHYLWTNGSLTYTTPAPSTLSSGLWSVTVTDALTGCQVKDVFFITQPPPITLQLGSSSPSACVSHSAVLGGIAGGGTPGYTYSWSQGPAGPDYTVSSNTPGTLVYSLTATDSLGCKKTSTISILYVPNPPVMVSGQAICPLETGTLAASGAASYTWTGNVTGATFTASPMATTLYSVTGSAQGCTATASAAIILKPVPVPMIASNSPRCETSVLQLFAGGGNAYVWSGPQGFTASGASTSMGPLVPSHAGVYQVTVTAANGCTASASTSVTVHPVPVLLASGSTVCTTQTLQLQASSAPGATFLWTGPAGFTSSSQNPAIVLPALGAGGNYSVVVTSVETCTNSAVAHASVVTPPVLTLSPPGGTFCAQPFGSSPASVSLGVSGANTYTLFASPNLSASGSAPVYYLTSTSPYFPFVTPASATVAGSNGICTSTAAASFSIIPNPVVSVISPSPLICAGETFTFYAGGAASYTWNSSAAFSALPSGAGIVTQPSITSNFGVAGYSLGCASDLVVTQLVVNPVPTVFIDPPLSQICLQNTATLVASGTATDYKWEPVLYIDKSTGPVVHVAPPADQVYTVTGTALNCTNQAVASVIVLPLPAPSISVSKNKVCLNDPVTLGGTGGIVYHWFGPNGLYFGGNPVTFSLSHLSYAGEYTLVVSDSNKCRGSTSAYVGVMLLPGGDLLSQRFAACVPFCSDFTFAPAAEHVTARSWTVTKPGGGLPVIKQGEKFSHCFAMPGEYLIKGLLWDSITGCKADQTFAVNGFEKPVAGFSWTPESPVEDVDEISLVNTSSGAGQNKWTWYFDHDKKLTARTRDTRLLLKDEGNYTMVMVVENTWGCVDTAINVIRVLPDFAFYMPNAFTPNADGKNETLRPSVRAVDKDYRFQVFNRWGERLFVTGDPQEGWDGTYRGLPCKQDTYVWLIDLTAGREIREFRGTVFLFR